MFGILDNNETALQRLRRARQRLEDAEAELDAAQRDFSNAAKAVDAAEQRALYRPGFNLGGIFG
jgi:exonuclease VII small subunit